MMYAYEDLGDDQFETLVVFVCRRLLGAGVQNFSQGPDGGRDAKFVGTADLHPSKMSPWSGTTVAQAKHANGYNQSFSDTDFFSPTSQNTVIGKELPRIKALRAAGELDHYMLFSNRRMSALAEQKIRAYISKECGIPLSSIYLCGVEQIEMHLKDFDDIPAKAKLDMVDSPLIVSSGEIADIVEALATSKAIIAAALDVPPEPRTSYEEKNAINNMTADYAKGLQKRYLKETPAIKTFLAAPESAEYLRAYEAAADELHLKIVAKKKDHQTFDEIMNYAIDMLFARDAVLRANKRLTRAVLFYMYWNCDIGETEHAAAV